VKDGVRVSEIELQPGGMIPTHHHNGPHLLVAVTDLEVRSDVEGQGPMPGHFKAGAVKWLRAATPIRSRTWARNQRSSSP